MVFVWRIRSLGLSDFELEVVNKFTSNPDKNCGKIINSKSYNSKKGVCALRILLSALLFLLAFRLRRLKLSIWCNSPNIY